MLFVQEILCPRFWSLNQNNGSNIQNNIIYHHSLFFAWTFFKCNFVMAVVGSKISFGIFLTDILPQTPGRHLGVVVNALILIAMYWKIINAKNYYFIVLDQNLLKPCYAYYYNCFLNLKFKITTGQLKIITITYLFDTNAQLTELPSMKLFWLFLRGANSYTKLDLQIYIYGFC